MKLTFTVFNEIIYSLIHESFRLDIPCEKLSTYLCWKINNLADMLTCIL